MNLSSTIQLAWLAIQIYKRQKKEELEQNLGNTSQGRRNWQAKIPVALHGLLMCYSFIMLLGAGISFPFRQVSISSAIRIRLTSFRAYDVYSHG